MMGDGNPKSTRNPDGTFKKGYTANRKGAPLKAKRSRPMTAFDILFHEDFDPVAPDLPSDLSPEDEAAYRTFHAAIQGSKRARRLILKHIVRRSEEQIHEAMTSERAQPVKILFEPHDPDNADEAMRILQIAAYETESVDASDGQLRPKLSPWAVQAAIRRRHGGKRLSSREVEQIKFFTANAQRLIWPRGYLDHRKKAR